MGRRGLLWLAGFVAALALFVHSCVRFVPASEKQAEIDPAPEGGALKLPVAQVSQEDLVDTFAQSRSEGRSHDAIDILAPRGTTVLAAAPGRIEKLFESVRGGKTLYVRSADRRWVYYYAHLDAYRPGLAEGQAVRAGETIGTVGSTGNADPAGPHLHFAVNLMRASERWYQGKPVNPYPLLVGRPVRPAGSGR